MKRKIKHSKRNLHNTHNSHLIKKKLDPKLIVITAFILFSIIGLSLYIMKSLEEPKKEEMTYKFKKEGELTFTRKDGVLVRKIAIELADTENKRTLGLMYRDQMEEDEGMLFVFPDSDFRSFWMKNTILPLDIIFVSETREIVTIQKNAVPYSEQSLPSSKPAKYVVEVNAGFTDRYGISEGDLVVF